ncbi:endonuclease/exonuclease/phosphatase family protein [Actinomadura terrae]|uniref:endonuclease/exonuclease/phosphatase family protein n=1 Tax=Actinomadura terrae TaxID=604353 RepID=UPI001FA7B80B|nr:endonuclease/exonuclease/phosphatase family protein [Actinomadura terrae]
MILRKGAGGRGPARRGRWVRVLASGSALVVLASVLSVVAGVVRPGQALARPLDQHIPMTYNMQGAGDGGQGAKWTNTVKKEAKTHDVIALQEAGSRPNMGTPERAASDHGMRVDRYRWQVESAPRDPLHMGGTRNVYFMETDPGGHRVNLAIVTPYNADQIIIIPPGFENSRPAFGIRLGTTVFFTMHGLSGGGNDDRRLLTEMDNRVGASRWVALGDFNREPDRWNRAGSRPGDPGFVPGLPTLPGAGRIYNSGQPTHVISSGVERELDYMVTNADLPGTWGGERIGDLSSDHVPVTFGPLALDKAGRTKGLTNRKDGDAVDQRYVTRLNRYRAVVKPRSATATQRYKMRPMSGGWTRIVNEYHQCLREVNTPISRPPNLHTQVFWDPCGQSSYEDQWRLNFSTLHSGYFSLLNRGTGRCLALNGDDLAGRECTGGDDDDQLFRMAPTLTGVSDVTWTIAGPDGPREGRAYEKMINVLRTASSHSFRGQVTQTTEDPESLLRLTVELPPRRGRSNLLTLFLTAHDTRLRGWEVDDRLFQFNDWHLGRRLGREVTTLPFAGDEAALRRAYVRTGGSPFFAEATQRWLSPDRIEGALNALSNVSNDHVAATAGLVISTVITQAAHYGAVSMVSTQALGDPEPWRIHPLNNTMYGLFDDWEALSRFARNITDDPEHTAPLRLHNPDITVRTFREAANFVILIS